MEEEKSTESASGCIYVVFFGLLGLVISAIVLPNYITVGREKPTLSARRAVSYITRACSVKLTLEEDTSIKNIAFVEKFNGYKIVDGATGNKLNPSAKCNEVVISAVPIDNPALPTFTIDTRTWERTCTQGIDYEHSACKDGIWVRDE